MLGLARLDTGQLGQFRVMMTSVTTISTAAGNLSLATGLLAEERQGRMLEERQGRMLEEISGMYSNIFGSQSGPDRENHPVVFLPDGSKKGCVESGGMSAMGYLAFVVSGTFK